MGPMLMGLSRKGVLTCPNDNTSSINSPFPMYRSFHPYAFFSRTDIKPTPPPTHPKHTEIGTICTPSSLRDLQAAQRLTPISPQQTLPIGDTDSSSRLTLPRACTVTNNATSLNVRRHLIYRFRSMLESLAFSRARFMRFSCHF